MTRYPLSDLLEATGLTIREFAEHLNKNRRWGYQLNERGLTFDEADRFAIRFGLMAYDVWSEWQEEADAIAQAEEERLAAEAEDRRQRALAAGRKYQAKKRAEPEFREQRLAYLREYRATFRIGLNADRRRYYQANRDREISAEKTRRAARRHREKASA